MRIVNTNDLVPKVPPELLGYAHVGEAYEICFDSDDLRLLPDYGLRHSATNYARTLARDFDTSVVCKLEAGKPDDLNHPNGRSGVAGTNPFGRFNSSLADCHVTRKERRHRGGCFADSPELPVPLSL